jgi:putative nucleotidyltransferase with HDIG domain
MFNLDSTEYKKHNRLTYTAQLVISILVFITETAVNIMLYYTHSDGYTSDTLGSMLFRYLFITSVINFGAVAISQIVISTSKNVKLQNWSMILAVFVICSNVCISHYRFAICFAVMCIPILISAYYEEKKFTFIVSMMCFASVVVSNILRSLNGDFDTIAPEFTIAIVFMVAATIYSLILVEHFTEKRQQLDDAALYKERSDLYLQIDEEKQKLKKLTNQMFTAMSKITELNSEYTAGHSKRVGKISREIAKRLGMSDEECEQVYYAGLLHDIGKIAIDQSLIEKEDDLTDEEYEIVKKHTIYGYEILKSIDIEKYADGALYHHERPDGKGYPNGITDIPIIGRIIAVADAYDAMLSNRPYRDSLVKSEIRKEFESKAGTQFDEVCVEIILSIMDDDILTEVIEDVSRKIGTTSKTD